MSLTISQLYFLTEKQKINNTQIRVLHINAIVVSHECYIAGIFYDITLTSAIDHNVRKIH